MNISDVLSVIAMLMALASLAHSLHQAKESRRLATEEKLTTLRELAHEVAGQLNEAQAALESFALALEEDLGYLEFWETSTGERDSVGTIRTLAQTARDQASSIEAVIHRLESIATKARSRGIALRQATSPVEIEEMIGIFRVKLVAAQRLMRSIEREQTRAATIKDRYTTLRQQRDGGAATSSNAG